MDAATVSRAMDATNGSGVAGPVLGFHAELANQNRRADRNPGRSSDRTPDTGPGPPFAALTCGPRLTFSPPGFVETASVCGEPTLEVAEFIEDSFFGHEVRDDVDAAEHVVDLGLQSGQNYRSAVTR